MREDSFQLLPPGSPDLYLGDLTANFPGVFTLDDNNTKLVVNQTGVYKVNLSAIFSLSFNYTSIPDNFILPPINLRLMRDGSLIEPFWLPVTGQYLDRPSANSPPLEPRERAYDFIGSRECLIYIVAGQELSIQFVPPSPIPGSNPPSPIPGVSNIRFWFGTFGLERPVTPPQPQPTDALRLVVTRVGDVLFP